jgi:hypothetical protein
MTFPEPDVECQKSLLFLRKTNGRELSRPLPRSSQGGFELKLRLDDRHDFV